MASWAGPVGATVARAALKLVIAGCAIIFNYLVVGWIMDSYYVQLAPLYDNWGITYPYGASLGVQSTDAYDLGMVTLTWLPLLLAAYATMILQCIPHGTVPRAYKVVKRQIGRVLAWELPGRRFWIWWCGGMNVRDALALAFYVGIIVWYFTFYFTRYTKGIDSLISTGVAIPASRSLLLTERAGLTCGICMWPCIWFLFFPIPQSSFLQNLFGMTYSEMIRYHRWMGHITMVVLSLHGWLYYIYWAAIHEFWINFSDWDNFSPISFLAGSISYFFAVALWATSINWCRRKFFEVFYRFHIVCFLGFMLFAYVHYYWSWTYFLPSLLLYAVDIALRAGQLSNTTLVTGAAVDQKAGMATFQVKTSKTVSACPVHELFMMVPSISRWQWHPFTVAGTQPDPQGGGSILTISAKRYGKWTREFLDCLQSAEPVPVRVSAPPGISQHLSWKGYRSIVMLGGGVGATPLLAMLRHMVQTLKEDPAAAKAGLPERVHFVWASRQPREFCLLDADLVEAASCPDGWLTIELYSTKPVPEFLQHTSSTEQHSPTKNSEMAKADSSDDGKELAAMTAIPHGADSKKLLSSPFFHKHATVIQSQTIGLWHLALVYLLVWLGCFLGTYLGNAYDAEGNTYLYSIDYPGYLNHQYITEGAIWFFTQTIMSIGVPYIFAVLPIHIWRYWRATRQPGSPEVLPLAPPTRPVGHGSGSQLVGGRITCCGETGLEIKSGRPDLRGAMLAVAKGYARSDTVGVFVGGPEPMTQQVHLETAAFNDPTQPGPYFELKVTAHEL